MLVFVVFVSYDEDEHDMRMTRHIVKLSVLQDCRRALKIYSMVCLLIPSI